MILDAIDKSFQALTMGPTPIPLPFYVVYSDTGADLSRPVQSSNGEISESVSDILSAPALDSQTEQSYIKELKYLSITNPNTSPQTILFYSGVASVPSRMFQCTLNPNWTVEYIEGQGWKIMDDKGLPVGDCSNEGEEHKVLEQLAIPATTLTNLYVVPLGYRFKINEVLVCNRSATTTAFSMSIAINGEADSDKQYIYKDLPIDGHDTFFMEPDNELSITGDDIIRVYADLANLSITLHGTLTPLKTDNES